MSIDNLNGNGNNNLNGNKKVSKPFAINAEGLMYVNKIKRYIEKEKK